MLAAADGEALVSPAQLARLSRGSAGGARRSAPISRAEMQLLNHLARGQSNKAIADELHLSVNTIRNYMQSVLLKLDAHSKLEPCRRPSAKGSSTTEPPADLAGGGKPSGAQGTVGRQPRRAGPRPWRPPRSPGPPQPTPNRCQPGP